MGDAPFGPEPDLPSSEALAAAWRAALVRGRPAVTTGLLLAVIAKEHADLRDRLPGLTADALGADASTGQSAGPAERPGAAVRQPAAGGADSGRAVDVAHGPGAASLREARWWVLRNLSGRDRAHADAGGDPVWSAGLRTALAEAAAQAGDGGWIGIGVLAAAALRHPDPELTAWAAAAGADLPGIARAVRSAPGSAVEPYTPMLGMLTPLQALDPPLPAPLRLLTGFVARRVGRDPRWGGPVLPNLESEVLRQAVRAGHDRVTTEALLLAVLSLDAQLAAGGVRLAERFRAHNRGGELLRAAGLPAAPEPADGAEPGDVLGPEETARRLWSGGRPGDPVWGRRVIDALDRAGELARAAGHSDIGTTHVLAAALDDAESAAVRWLHDLGVDTVRLRQSASWS
ncbi:Clp protease N-terminal domain-containing protein [Catenuloplanes atrovinosus]|uniref:Clp R domain-containing protein n=1 Tax=Catenuloplanes atrovinosus TaxID=137266 RepID=A0AAE3YRU9_9ACTN|nr:Clp protease N-terminal domain-containing protein [Catenuloplanes atrovinosus]MDR7276606.1 hypothetical protein [Catenuloplanes atrovinosus]